MGVNIHKIRFLFIRVVPAYLKWIAALVTVRLRPKIKTTYQWLVAERKTDAKDNGYFFYRYLKSRHPEIKSAYIIDPKSPDYNKVAQLGGVIESGSFTHYLALAGAQCLISSHIAGYAPDVEVFMLLQKYGVWRPHAKQIFLQHGITKADIEGLKYPHVKLDLFVCGALDEFHYIRDHYHFPEGVVAFTGLARYDTLTNLEGKKQILVMPTWRKWLNSLSEQAFCETEYYAKYHSLLTNQALAAALTHADYTLVFYPHDEMQKFLGAFRDCASDTVRLGGLADCDIQILLRESALLVTDYSSVYFDMAYMQKPILFYQFDSADFYGRHYAKGYISEGNLGKVCPDEETLVGALTAYLTGATDFSQYKENMTAFFGRKDTSNCERIFESIQSLMEYEKK